MPPVTTLPNGTIQSETNANVYYSSVPKQTETLVGNSERPSGFRLANPQQSFLQNSAGSRSVTRVSWAQPIASPLPVSPGSEDESANSDTPLYENTGAEKNSPKIQKLGQTSQATGVQKQRPVSSPDALEEAKKFYGGKGVSPRPTNEGGTPVSKKDSPFGSTSALSRLAAAIPFVRNSFRLPSSSSDFTSRFSDKKGNKALQKNGSRGALEISKPILQTDHGTAQTQQDQVDSCPRYANVPVQPEEGQQAKKPALKNVDRVRGVTPPPEPSTKPIPKVQRAHSMIQPSNRNSINNGNSNYNSLRRPRPSVPPPKPPEAPPPPPPTYMQSSFSEAKSKFLLNSATTPPPVPPPNVSSSPLSQSPKVLRTPISRFPLFANRSRSASPTTPQPKPSEVASTPSPTSSASLHFKAPIAKVDELCSPCSPPGSTGIKKEKTENIYDTIDEGMVHAVLSVANPRRKGSLDGSSSGDSSPTPGKNSNSRRGSEEKIETLSTGSSESAGGLLNDIIQEIQTRNKESIYNSVDRRRQRREKKVNAANSSLLKERNQKPELTPKPAIVSLSKPSPPRLGLTTTPTSSKTESSSASLSKPPNKASTTQYSPSNRYTSPLANQSFSFYKRPSGPSSSAPGTSSVEAKPQVTLNSVPEVTPAPAPSSRPSYSSSIYAATSSASAPRSIFSSTFSRTGLSTAPPVTIVSEDSKSSSAPITNGLSNGSNSSVPVPATPPNPVQTPKPTCAVNGVPKVTSSPSYVAKINYFSNLSQAANTPMKPVNSIPAPSKGNPAKEIIYAPSNIDLNELDGDGRHERGHYAATIRRSRPQYYNNKDLESNMNDANSNPLSDNCNRNKGTLGRKPMGIYGSLGRKVATPVIRSNSIEKEKREAKSRESTPDTTHTVALTGSTSDTRSDADGSVHSAPTMPLSDSSNASGSPQVGYKPFNPYLNRPLTFSTFRPVSSPAASNAGSAKTGVTTPPTCSISSKPLTSLSNGVGVGVASPVRLRSPNRLVK